MVTLAVNNNQVFQMVEQLSEKEKEKIFERLQNMFYEKRWNNLLKRVEEKKKRHPITDEEIEKEVSFARKEFHKNRR